MLELMVLMRSKGWEWAVLPSKKSDRLGLTYGEGSPLKFYTSGITVSKSYLLCLLNAEHLRANHAIQAIPHGLPADAYDLVLKALQPQQALLSLQENRPAGKKRAVALEQDVEECVEREQQAPPKTPKPAAKHRPRDLQQSVCDANGAGGGNTEDVAKEGSVAESYDSLEAALEALIDEECSEDRMKRCSRAHERCNKSGRFGFYAGADRDARTCFSACSPIPEPGQPPKPEVPEPPEPALPRAKRAKTASTLPARPRLAAWGPFVFHRKSAASSPPFGGVEVVCPFHALNDKTL